MVLIHGYCETGAVWNGMIRALSDYRLIIPDLPGFGKSELTAKLSIDMVAETLVEKLSKKGIEEFIPIGHSLGGYITLAIAEKYPEKIQSFGLFHSSAFADNEEKKEARNQVVRIVEQKGPQFFLKNFYSGLFHKDLPQLIEELEEKGKSIDGDSIIAYAKAMRDRPDRSSLLKSGHHKLIVAGDMDNAIPYSASQEMFSIAENSLNITLENVGHMGMYEDTGGAVQAFKKFLRKVTN